MKLSVPGVSHLLWRASASAPTVHVHLLRPLPPTTNCPQFASTRTMIVDAFQGSELWGIAGGPRTLLEFATGFMRICGLDVEWNPPAREVDLAVDNAHEVDLPFGYDVEDDEAFWGGGGRRNDFESLLRAASHLVEARRDFVREAQRGPVLREPAAGARDGSPGFRRALRLWEDTLKCAGRWAADDPVTRGGGSASEIFASWLALPDAEVLRMRAIVDRAYRRRLDAGSFREEAP